MEIHTYFPQQLLEEITIDEAVPQFPNIGIRITYLHILKYDTAL